MPTIGLAVLDFCSDGSGGMRIHDFLRGIGCMLTRCGMPFVDRLMTPG